MSKWTKPEHPVPNRTDPLWDQCLFAFAVGGNPGARVSTPNLFVAKDDQRESRGSFSSSVQGHFVISDPGRSLDTLGAGADIFDWADVGGRYAISRGFTAAVVVKPLTTPTLAGLLYVNVWAKLGADFLNKSWSIDYQGNTGDLPAPGWRFTVNSTAAVEVTIPATTAPSIARTDLIIGVYDRVNQDIWINGRREGRIANTLAVFNNSTYTLNIRRAVLGATAPNFRISMIALWNRPLVASEIARLSSDPYMMWKSNEDIEALGFVAPAPAGQAFGDCCTCPSFFNGPLAPIFN